jgi:hypothetical protein
VENIEESPYNVFPELGGKEHIVKDGIVTWDIGSTGLPFADTSIFDYENRHRHYDVEFEWMGLQEFMDAQYQIYMESIERHNEYIRRERSRDTPWTLLRKSEYWEKTPTQSKVRNIIKLMQDGEVFQALVIEYDNDGTLHDFQEGRHRSLALKFLGKERVPVWIVRKRF